MKVFASKMFTFWIILTVKFNENKFIPIGNRHMNLLSLSSNLAN